VLSLILFLFLLVIIIIYVTAKACPGCYPTDIISIAATV
jgi:hypothetical protein